MKGRGWSPAAREAPAAAGFDASLHHVSGWPVLSITASPQTMELELINRTPYPVTAGPAHLNLVFRPGVLSSPQDIVLAPQSDVSWALSIHEDAAGRNVSLAIAGVERLVLAPGEALRLRLDNVSAAEAGGSRATRVQLHIHGFFHPDGREVRSTQLMHLPVLRRHEPQGLPATALRTGSTAASGPFLAGFLDGADVLNDGRSANTLKLRVVNSSGRPIALSSNDDEATRFYLSFRTGTDGAGWGLLGSPTDHVDVEVQEPGWQVDNHTIRRSAPGDWGPREALDINLTVYSNALAGDAQLVLSYENLPGHDDGDLVLLARLGPMAARDDTVVVHAPAGLQLSGDLAVSGTLRSGAHHPDFTPAVFKLGGDIATYYPVVFEDLSWERGEFRFEVFRARTHVDGEWRGSMMSRITCHNDRFGEGSEFWSIEVRQSTATSAPTRRFVGGLEPYPYDARLVLWLLGDTTYGWLANHPARIDPVTKLDAPGTVSLGSPDKLRRYDTRREPFPGYAADHVSISRSLGRDSSPVPAGAVILWPKDQPLPAGWAILGGSSPATGGQLAGLVCISKQV
jgi:hypothetical protein